MVSPSQLFGIEIEFYAHELASIVVWIGFLQWKHEHGVQEDREPVLEKLDNIEHGDAIMRYDAEGKPYEPEWQKADFIIGNPPFLGGTRRCAANSNDKYVDDLRGLYDGRSPRRGRLGPIGSRKPAARSKVARSQAGRTPRNQAISMVGNRPCPRTHQGNRGYLHGMERQAVDAGRRCSTTSR
jgi:hypothetical protein